MKVEYSQISLLSLLSIYQRDGLLRVYHFLQIRTMHRRWEAFRGESKEEKDLLFTAKKSKLFQFKTELDIFLANNKGEVPDFKVKGGYGESSCSILLGDSNTMLAQVSSMLSFILESYLCRFSH